MGVACCPIVLWVCYLFGHATMQLHPTLWGLLLTGASIQCFIYSTSLSMVRTPVMAATSCSSLSERIVVHKSGRTRTQKMKRH